MSSGRSEQTLGSAAWDARYAGRELLWTAEPNRFLVAETEPLAPGRALDLGCGEGRNAVWLARRGWRVTGVDFSHAGIEKARRLAAARGVSVDWVEADLVGYAPQREGFELVLVLYLQLPAAQRSSILATAAAAVAPGGLLLVVGHDSANLARGYGGPQDPHVLYSAEDVAADLRRGGRRIERAERVERRVETAEGSRVALDALVRASRDESAALA